MRVIAGGGVIIVLAQVLNAGLVARGDTKAFRNVLFAMMILNVGFDPLLMFGYSLGTVQVVPALREAGTAIAMVALQGAGLVYLIARGIRKGVYHGASFRRCVPRAGIMRELIGQSAPATLDSFVINYFISIFWWSRRKLASMRTASRAEPADTARPGPLQDETRGERCHNDERSGDLREGQQAG